LFDAAFCCLLLDTSIFCQMKKNSHYDASAIESSINIYQDFAWIKVPCHQSACREFQNLGG
jgi:hypothetical protein